MKVVSDRFVQCANRCMAASVRPSPSSTTATGLPRYGVVVKTSTWRKARTDPSVSYRCRWSPLRWVGSLGRHVVCLAAHRRTLLKGYGGVPRLSVEQGKHAFDVGDGCFADDVAADADLFGLRQQLGGHLFIGAHQQERRTCNILGRCAGNRRADLIEASCPVLRDRYDLHERFNHGCVSGALRLLAHKLQLALQVRA